MSNSVFFAPAGAKGLNETSATKLAAVASNLKTKLEAVLANPSFLNVKVAIIGSSEQLDYGTGMSYLTLSSITDMCHRIGELNGFISWLSEGRKAIEAERDRIKRLNISDWAKAVGKELPIAPGYENDLPRVTLQTIIEEMNVKERAEYLALEAKAAQLGKLIHPDGPFDDARNELHKRVNCPQVAEGKGRDMLIRSYEASVDPDAVDRIYEELQRQYQNYESSLNHIKSELRKKLDTRQAENNAKERLMLEEYREKDAKYRQTLREMTVEFNQWHMEQISASAKIRLAIPECYEALLQGLYNVGK